MAHLVDELNLPDFTFYAWDARGHGRSPGKRGCSPSFAHSVRDIDAFMREIKASLADTWFAWSGPLEAGKAYFRVQGPTILIEYAPQRLGGDVTMHLHSMYRDPTNDYGRKLAGK